MDQRAWVNLGLSVLPLVFIFAVLGILALSGFFEWFGDKTVDRKLGKGQGSLSRQALRDEAIPPGMDVAAWRASLARTKEPSLVSSMLGPALLLVLALWFVISSKDFAELLGNVVFVLIAVALGIFVWLSRQRQLRERRLLLRLLDDHNDDQ